jgi:hypothetical protein
MEVDFRKPETIPRPGGLALVWADSYKGALRLDWELCQADYVQAPVPGGFYSKAVLCWNDLSGPYRIREGARHAPVDRASLKGMWTKVDEEDKSTWPAKGRDCLLRHWRDGDECLVSTRLYVYHIYADEKADRLQAHAFYWHDFMFGASLRGEPVRLQNGDEWLCFEVEEGRG